MIDDTEEAIKAKMRLELRYLFSLRDDLLWRHRYTNESEYEDAREKFIEIWTQRYLGKLSN